MYSVNFNGINFNPSQDDFYKLAWDCAVEDNLVEADKKDEYLLKFIE